MASQQMINTATVIATVAVKQLCRQCGIVFVLPANNSDVRFCSRSCWQGYHRLRHPYLCTHCGITFYRITLYGRHAFCSKWCCLLWFVREQPLEHDEAGYAGSYYGPNWPMQRRAARQRDHYCCRRCGASEQLLGYELHIHHRQPFRTFGYIPGKNDYYLLANRLTNLISLCAECHPKMETAKEEV